MAEDINNNSKYPGQAEDKALSAFLKSLHLALKQAAAYFPEHPAYHKSIQSLKVKIDSLSIFRKTIDISASPDRLLVDNRYLDKDNFIYRELSSWLHNRKVKKLGIDTDVSREVLADFIYKLSQAQEKLKKGFSVKDIVPEPKGIEIEELDYSHLLYAKGRCPQDVWDVLLGKKSRDEAGAKTLDYLAGHIEDIIDQVKSISPGKDVLTEIFESLERIVAAENKMPEQKAHNLIEGLSNSLFHLPEDFMKVFLDERRFINIKNKLADRIDQEFFFKNIVSQVLKGENYNPLFVSLCRSVLVHKKDDDQIVRDVGRYISKKADARQKEKFKTSIKELFLYNSSDRFISQLYKNTLDYLKDYTTETSFVDKAAEYSEEMKPENIDYQYSYTLLELFNLTQSNIRLRDITPKLYEQFSWWLPKNRGVLLKDMVELMEEKAEYFDKTRSENPVKEIYSKICSKQTLESLLKGENKDLAEFMVRRVHGGQAYILSKLVEADNINEHKLIKAVLKRTAQPGLIHHIKEVLNKNPGFLVLKELIEIIAHIKSPKSLKLLRQIYQDNKNNIMLVQEIVRIMKTMPSKDKEFLGQFLFSENFTLRKEAVAAFFKDADAGERKEIVRKLLSVNNFLGFKNKFIIENLQIFSWLNCKEIIPFLEKFIRQKPVVFKKWRDFLRIESLKVLDKLDSDAAFQVAQEVSDDKNIRVQNLAGKIIKNGPR